MNLKNVVSGQRNSLNIMVIFTSMRKLSDQEADLIVMSLMYYKLTEHYSN